MFKQSLAKLKEEMVKANTLVREANFLAQEMGKQTEFQVTLQIPAANLSPNRKVNNSETPSDLSVLINANHDFLFVYYQKLNENQLLADKFYFRNILIVYITIHIRIQLFF